LGLRACATEIIWFFNSDSAVGGITQTAENRVRRWRLCASVLDWNDGICGAGYFRQFCCEINSFAQKTLL